MMVRAFVRTLLMVAALFGLQRGCEQYAHAQASGANAWKIYKVKSGTTTLQYAATWKFPSGCTVSGGILDLSTCAGASFPLAAPAGTVGAPSYSFSGDTDTGMYSGGANDLRLSIGGADYLKLAAAAVTLGVPGTNTMGALSLSSGAAILRGPDDGGNGDAYNVSNGEQDVYVSSTHVGQWLANGLHLLSTGIVNFGSDTGLSRSTTSTVFVTDGSSGEGSLRASRFIVDTGVEGAGGTRTAMTYGAKGPTFEATGVPTCALNTNFTAGGGSPSCTITSGGHDNAFEVVTVLSHNSGSAFTTSATALFTVTYANAFANTSKMLCGAADDATAAKLDGFVADVHVYTTGTASTGVYNIKQGGNYFTIDSTYKFSCIVQGN